MLEMGGTGVSSRRKCCRYGSSPFTEGVLSWSPSVGKRMKGRLAQMP